MEKRGLVYRGALRILNVDIFLGGRVGRFVGHFTFGMKIMASHGKFSCTDCGREYSWKAELAGRSAKCKCGVVMRVPERLPGADEDAGLYELAAGAELARPAAEATPVVRPPVAA